MEPYMSKKTLEEMEEKLAELQREMRSLGGEYTRETNKKRWSLNSHINYCFKRIEVLTLELRKEQKQEFAEFKARTGWKPTTPEHEHYNPPITITSAPLDVPLPAAVLANVATVEPQDVPAEDLDALIAGLVP
jgi:hypothetical protein